MKVPESEEMYIVRYADDFRIFCRTKEDAVSTKEGCNTVGGRATTASFTGKDKNREH